MQGLMEIGTLSAFTSYAVGILSPSSRLPAFWRTLSPPRPTSNVSAAFWKRYPLFRIPPDVVEKHGDNFVGKTENWEPIRGDIEFRDVTFRYPDGNENILEHFNLKIPAGTTVAIVGETGAGKSTLVNLACRFLSQQRVPSSSTAGTTGNAPSCGCTAISAMCCKILIYSPAPSKKISVTGVWMPPMRKLKRLQRRFQRIRWSKSWKTATIPM